jgi:hypothetical protein
MARVVRAFPLLSSRSALESFAAQLKGQRATETAQFYRHYGVSSESWHLQDTPSGPWVIAVTELDNPAEAAPRYADASEEFHVWFKTQVLALTGVDPPPRRSGLPPRRCLRSPISRRKPLLDRRATGP